MKYPSRKQQGQKGNLRATAAGAAAVLADVPLAVLAILTVEVCFA